MNVLVTGALGTIGSGLVAELTSRGHRVLGCDLSHAANQMGFSVGTDVAEPSYVRCDISEFRQIERLFSLGIDFDVVYNCAAEFGRWNGEDHYEQLWRTNVIGTKHLIRLQELHHFKMVHFSSSEVYGDWPSLMTESVMDNHEVRQLNDYAMTKWVNEMQLGNSAKVTGTQNVIVRLFNTYGPGEFYSPYRSVNCRFLYCALHGLPWVVYRGHSRSSTYLADTTRTLANIMENFRAGETYNIGGDRLHTIEELSDLVLRVTGADPSLVSFSESEVLTTRIKQVDISKAQRDLDHRLSVSLEEGLRLTVEWMRSVYPSASR